MERITVLLADDHSLVREVLEAYLRAAADLMVVGSVGNAEEAVQWAVQLRPNVVLMDIDMPGLEAFEAADLIRDMSPNTRIIYLSAFVHDRYIERALRVEASGYISKSEAPDVVVNAIRQVTGGMAYYSGDVRARIVVNSRGADVTRTATLTKREREILPMVAEGVSKREIAARIHVSERTVNTHCANLMAKLDIHDRVGLTRYAIREGMAQA
jgi:DNA-binding NarL/FixJ family response regulator